MNKFKISMLRKYGQNLTRAKIWSMRVNWHKRLLKSRDVGDVRRLQLIIKLSAKNVMFIHAFLANQSVRIAHLTVRALNGYRLWIGRSKHVQSVSYMLKSSTKNLNFKTSCNVHEIIVFLIRVFWLNNGRTIWRSDFNNLLVNIWKF
jgi:hypothetical protein